MTDHMLEPVPADIVSLPAVVAGVEELRRSVATIDPDDVDTDVVHAAIHGLRDLGRTLHESGGGAPSQQGTVAQINVSDGGVPKTPIPAADVVTRGVVGDRQTLRTHHGRPFQALSLWSIEVIDALAAEGHPIHAGAAGENITVSGIDWSTLRPGVRLLVGQVACEISGWATPCRKNDQWFTGRSDRMHHDLHPGWSRAYAWVLEPGTVTTGDPVHVEP